MPGQWHPLVDAVEIEPTVFELRDQFGTPHAIVRLVTVAHGRKAWRAVTWAALSEDRHLIAYSWRLHAAVRAAHLHWVRERGPARSIAADDVVKGARRGPSTHGHHRE